MIERPKERKLRDALYQIATMQVTPAPGNNSNSGLVRYYRDKAIKMQQIAQEALIEKRDV